jgi:D-sedoheptulose 7-phosphate isomerase
MINQKDEISKLILETQEAYINPLSFPLEAMNELANRFVATFNKGNKVAFVGNGGSAAEAMHLAAEFTGKCVSNHSPLPVVCLNESQSSLTAIANDFGVEFIFSRQVRAHLKKGDLMIALSTSGRSLNVINALEEAKEIGVECVLWMGDFDFNQEGFEIWKVPSQSTPRIQEIHLSWGHIIAQIVEKQFP